MNVTLDMILGVGPRDILISWFVIILALLAYALLCYSYVVYFIVSVCISQMQINSVTYLLSYLVRCVRDERV